jgi:glycosyltransferase involved in cell wall biosynthesis
VISVLLPYRDASATVVRAAESVLAERVELELVAIDDGSCDGGFSALENMHNARIVHVRTSGVGIASALRAGLARARGSFIARMDADDVSVPGRIAAEVETLERDARVAACGCQVEPFADDDVAVRDGMRDYIAWQNGVITAEDHARAIFVESPLCHPATTIRRDALEAVGGFRDAPWAEDWDLWMRMDHAGFALAKVPRVLFRWRQDARSVTRRDPRCSIERMREGRAHYLAMRLRVMQRPIDMWGAGPTGKRLARALEAHGLRAARFVDVDPKKIGRVRRGVPVVAREEVTREHTVVVAVGTRGARDLVRADLSARGFVEGSDFIAAA